jgi:hypothetical protein
MCVHGRMDWRQDQETGSPAGTMRTATSEKVSRRGESRANMFEPTVVGAVVEVLAGLVGGGRALVHRDRTYRTAAGPPWRGGSRHRPLAGDASWAIKSSFAGHTYRKGVDLYSPRPSVDRGTLHEREPSAFLDLGEAHQLARGALKGCHDVHRNGSRWRPGHQERGLHRRHSAQTARTQCCVCLVSFAAP